MKEGNDINLYNEGNFYRDILHVDDAADGIKFVMDKGISGDTYNLGSGSKPVLFKDLISYLHQEIGSSSKIGSMDATDFHKIVQVESMYLDVSKIRHLGFTPSKTVFKAIHELI